MSDEGFLRRWSRLKSTGGDSAPPPVPPAPAPPPAAASQAEPEAAPRAPLLTLEDAAHLTPDADFSAFVAQGVDKSVRRLALKTLFADPHFKVLDGLDIYMNDYNKAAPLAPAMLASLKHAPDVLSRLFDDEQQSDSATGSEQGREPGREHEQTPPSTRQGNA